MIREIGFKIILGVFLCACGNTKNAAPEQEGSVVSNELNFMELQQPIPLTAKLEHERWFTWGASVLEGDDGKFHMIYCRWPKKYPFGDGWLIDAEMCYAVADSPTGPFEHLKTVIRPRKDEGLFNAWDGASVYNPHLKKFRDKFFLYYTATSDPYIRGESTNRQVLVQEQCAGVIEFNSFEELEKGIYKRSEEPLLAPLSKLGNLTTKEEEFGEPENITPANVNVTNPTVVQRPDGKYIMVFKGWKPNNGVFIPVHGVAIGDTPGGPFKVLKDPIFEYSSDANKVVRAEDPFIWFDKNRNSFYALVKDFNGGITNAGASLAFFKSEDGIKWNPAENLLASDLNIKWEDGNSQKVAHLERPQLLFNKKGDPVALYAACAIQSPFLENGHSFNIHIPLKNCD